MASKNKKNINFKEKIQLINMHNPSALNFRNKYGIGHPQAVNIIKNSNDLIKK